MFILFKLFEYFLSRTAKRLFDFFKIFVNNGKIIKDGSDKIDLGAEDKYLSSCWYCWYSKDEL